VSRGSGSGRDRGSPQSYAAEWHTSAIDELAALEVEWARFGNLSDDEMEKLAKPIGQATKFFTGQAENINSAPSNRLRR
jgi:hypothetical protein